MPIRHCIVHLIDKKPDGTPAVLHARDTELGDKIEYDEASSTLTIKGLPTQLSDQLKRR